MGVIVAISDNMDFTHCSETGFEVTRNVTELSRLCDFQQFSRMLKTTSFANFWAEFFYFFSESSVVRSFFVCRFFAFVLCIHLKRILLVLSKVIVFIINCHRTGYVQPSLCCHMLNSLPRLLDYMQCRYVAELPVGRCCTRWEQDVHA